MDHTAYVTTIREESERFLEALQGVDPTTPVPSCEGWTASDLLWHLGEVQHFWAQVARGATAEEVVTDDRPADADLSHYVARAGTELVSALADADPAGPAWSWHEEGGTLGWLARRQAHEALVHRVDAQLTAGHAVTPPSPALAADGVDEMLRVMVDGVPAWGDFVPDGTTVRIEAVTDAGAATTRSESAAPSSDWTLALGRFVGTSPDSGTAYDLDAAAVLEEDDGGHDALVVTGSPWALDLWLWGRGSLEGVQVVGDPAVAERLRTLFAEATQ